MEFFILRHIDNGRKTYATAASCALLGEIDLYEGRLAVCRQWYEDFMEGYKRFRALRAEMDQKVGSVLRSRQVGDDTYRSVKAS